MKRHLDSINRLRFLVTICLLASGLTVFSFVAHAQKRKPRRARTPASASPAKDYSHFSHATKKHQQACNTCHKVPTGNWKKVRDFPDVADYPDHDACVSCHRPQFFKGAKPVICSICHTKISPRDDARLAFRNPASERQFTIEFPHDKHQDVIAKLLRRFPAVAEPLFVPARFSVIADDKPKHYNNCEICHAPRTSTPLPPAGVWPDGFVPGVDSFKASPASHAACFNCHWKSQQPVNDNCASCHKLATAFHSVDTVKRTSMKFRHAREQHILECTTCHINITKASTLRGLKPDVPITSCTECHNKDGLRLDVSKELEAIDKNRDFVCSYCHTSDVGRLDPPASHYVIAGREPLKRQDIK